MTDRAYDALLLDLDGTLLTSRDQIRPENLTALNAARERGVCVMVVTGRSKMATMPILEQLDLDTPTVLFNGAAVYCPRQDRLVEERTLSRITLEKLFAHSEATGDLTVVMSSDRKVARVPATEIERRSLDGLVGVEFVESLTGAVEHVIRVTFISDRHPSSSAMEDEVLGAVGRPLYTTHFPLSVLPRHRQSRHQAVDVHPPCRGKAEALRVLEQTYGIPSDRVVAVGDATNDVPMIQAAGLGVAMGSGMQELLEVADRVIGSHEDASIAGLIGELFLA